MLSRFKNLETWPEIALHGGSWRRWGKATGSSSTRGEDFRGGVCFLKRRSNRPEKPFSGGDGGGRRLWRNDELTWGFCCAPHGESKGGVGLSIGPVLWPESRG